MVKKGFTLIEIAIVSSILGTIAVIAIPGLLRARVNANHSSVISDLRAFSTANEMYRAQQNPPAFAPDVATLTAGDVPFLDSSWNGANVAPGRHSYTFTYSVDASGAAFSVLAVPINTMGINTYCLDQTAVIFVGTGADAPTGTAAGCTGGTPLSG
ncbi:MAG: prepilin-type N-terminal cleavage/methylation domain-containing protein [Candidatus Omnitrophica bacterium]|nr:prepilin-type N-terminal cleavage/methylation domain-containing protein [Candidatus Omnitrophota bacterium]